MDRDTYLDRLGVDLEPGGRKPAPQPLRVVQRFANTHNHELDDDRDRLGTPGKATRWLIDNSLLEPGETITARDTRRLREGREAVRRLAGAGQGTRDRVGDHDLRIPLAIRVGDGPELIIEPMGPGADRILGALLVIVYEAMADGSWQRMKLCRQCSWLFFDHSRNRSGGWCSMAICGNRAKNRSYRRRGSG